MEARAGKRLLYALKHAFRFPSTPHKHARCMAYMYRLLKPSLSPTAREECEIAIDGLRTGAMSFPTVRAILAPYIIRHHIDTFIGDAYLFHPSWLHSAPISQSGQSRGSPPRWPVSTREL